MATGTGFSIPPAIEREEILPQRNILNPLVLGIAVWALQVPHKYTDELAEWSCSLPSPANPHCRPQLLHQVVSHTLPQPWTRTWLTSFSARLMSWSLTQIVLRVPLLLHLQFSDLDSVLIARFADLLQRELEKATTKLTSELKQDFQELGQCLDSIEFKVDETG